MCVCERERQKDGDYGRRLLVIDTGLVVTVVFYIAEVLYNGSSK